jgi:type IV pilus secretin PilQ/predicted competence protein
MRAKLAGALSLVILASLLAGGAVADDRAAAITEIRQESNSHSTRLVVACTGPVAYTYYSPDPLTLVVDIPEVDPSKVPSRISVGTREVESVRVTSMVRADGRSLARVEVRLASLVPYQIFSKDTTLNLVFERGADTASAGAAATRAAAPAPAPAPATPAAVKTANAPEPMDVPMAKPAAEPARPVEAAIVITPRKRQPAPAAEAPATVVLRGDRHPASRIVALSQADDDGRLSFDVKADGALRYQDFFLGNPDRLVIDFKDVTSRANVRTLEVNRDPVRKVRLAQFSAASPRVARLVLDLSAKAPYRIVEGNDGVKILFGEGEVPKAAPLAALKPEEDAAATTAAPMPEAAVPVQVLPGPAPMPVLPDPQAAPPAPQRPAEFEPVTLNPGEKQYTGHPISLDFKDGDLQDIFRLFADISGLNIVVNPGVSGKVTLKLNEVPWDQALDLILKANGLGYTLEGNVIRIAPLTALQNEEQQRRKLQEERALAGELASLTTRISYAKAQDLSDVLRKAGALSARGSLNVDPRTNTLIINDLPAFLEKAKELIATLDLPTRQVEIEARIVVTSRNFTRDLGIQWGFNQVNSGQFGNTTGLNFPNALIINGQGVPSQGGIPADQNGQASNAGIGVGGRGYAINLPAAGFNSAIGISLGNILGSFNLDAALTALERQGRGRLLSTPKITTQNNQAAEIKQGVQIPIQTVANNTVTVSFQDAVLTLKVTPQITEAGTVILTVDVQNNSADFANLVNGIPPINTQSAKTQVLVRDGATAVIGGIYQSNEQTSQSSTPFLGRVPILGYLFRNRFVTSTNNELLLFITPRIIKDRG